MPSRVEFTPAQEERLAGPEGHTLVADVLGTSERVVRRWRKEHGWVATARVAADGAPPVEGPTEVEMLRDEVRQLRSARRRDLKNIVADERAVAAIEAAADRTRPLLREPLLPPRAASSAAHHVQLGLWSDWHYGETVDREQMSGLAEYSTEIAEARVRQLVQSTLSFKRVRPEMTALHLAILGDMASGAIHGLEETNEVPAAEQYIRVGQLMGEAVEELAPHYPRIVIDATFGNHPRAKEAPVSKGGHNSGDWIAYKMAEAMTRHLPNVEWNIPRAGMIVRKIAGKTFLFWHGDGVRSSMPGVPWGGVMRRVNVLKSTYAAQGVYIDYVALGHFHQNAVVPSIFMNGALIGQNEYGLKNFGGGEAPSQLIVTLDEKRGRVTDVAYLSFEGA